MNLKSIYEIFYPGVDSLKTSVWEKRPKYLSKKVFFERLFPMELRWLNVKLWNDKARRSRFFSDCMKEPQYLSSVKQTLLQEPMTIFRIETKCRGLLEGNIFVPRLNGAFERLWQSEGITASPGVQTYLINGQTGELKQDCWNTMAFLLLYAMFPGEINQIYMSYIYKVENQFLFLEKEKLWQEDDSLFQNEFPPDMGIYKAGEEICHSWVIKNTGSMVWQKRYYACVSASPLLNRETLRIPLPDVVYPGENVTLTIRFAAPQKPGIYALSWKMMYKDGSLALPKKVGLGLHFTIPEENSCQKKCEEKDSYRVLEEKPTLLSTHIAGEIHSHTWVIQNTGSVTWKNYYCECLNGEAFHYAANELRIPMGKIVKPGESISLQIDFVTPPVEGVFSLIWKIMRPDGVCAFSEERQLEVLLHLI